MTYLSSTGYLAEDDFWQFFWTADDSWFPTIIEAVFAEMERVGIAHTGDAPFNQLEERPNQDVQ